MPWLINAAQLDKFRKNQKNIIILDATYSKDHDVQQAFAEKHIVGAQFFPIESCYDANAELGHTLLSDEKVIGERLGKLGIRNDYKIILYDNSSMRTACRALWLFKMFGHNPHLLYVVDGGLAAWESYGGKLESGSVTFGAKTYTAQLQTQWLRTLDDIKKNLHHPKEQVIDTRHPVLYAGGPPAREDLRPGHIPGSFCLPYKIFFEKDGTFLSLERIRKKLIDVGVDLSTPIITSCGSGNTGPILNFLLDLLSIPNAHYNGSWSEYGINQCYPGEQSLAERPVETCIDN